MTSMRHSIVNIEYLFKIKITRISCAHQASKKNQSLEYQIDQESSSSWSQRRVREETQSQQKNIHSNDFKEGRKNKRDIHSSLPLAYPHSCIYAVIHRPKEYHTNCFSLYHTKIKRRKKMYKNIKSSFSFSISVLSFSHVKHMQ